MYNIKTVVKLTGIPAVTIRAWENRYGAVDPERTEGGHRLYSERDVDDLRWLKRAMEEKDITISQAARLLKQAKEERREPATASMTVSAEAETEAEVPRGTFELLKIPLYDALVQYRTEEANRLIDRGFALYAYEDMFHHVLVPILHQVGDEWESGKISVAQEHFVSNMIYQRFHAFFRVLPIHGNLPRAVAFCPSGEQHQLGLLLFVLYLRRQGMEVLYMGADTPLDGVLQAIGSKQARYVCSSLTGKRFLAAAVEMLDNISAEYPDIRFVLGGKAFAEGKHPYKQYVLKGDPGSWERWFDEEMAERNAFYG
ncbi:MAG: hypothetical protein K0Q94_6010 [Paenibacillus sp.]|jgi:DNA-binding transcriptional MerR regulator|nr:hypothetical protein [Paenibacillus sp.]